jgi:hypothetical protein
MARTEVAEPRPAKGSFPASEGRAGSGGRLGSGKAEQEVRRKRRETITVAALVLALLGTSYLFWVLPKQLPPPHVRVTFEPR